MSVWVEGFDSAVPDAQGPCPVHRPSRTVLCPFDGGNCKGVHSFTAYTASQLLICQPLVTAQHQPCARQARPSPRARLRHTRTHAPAHGGKKYGFYTRSHEVLTLHVISLLRTVRFQQRGHYEIIFSLFSSMLGLSFPSPFPTIRLPFP